MNFHSKTRYLLVCGAVILASLIQFVRGYRVGIVAVAAVTFLIAGNATVYLSTAKERAVRRQQKRDYYAN